MIYKEQAVRLIKSGEFEEAINLLEKDFHETNDIQSLFLIAKYCFNNKPQKRISYLNKTVIDSELRHESWLLLGEAYNSIDNYIEAKRAYSKCLDYDSNSIDILINLGDIELKLKNYKKAEKLFTKALKIDNTDKRIFDSFGDLEYCLQNYKKAADYYKSSINIESSEWALKGLADSYFKLKKYNDAKSTYESIYSFNKTSKKIYDAELGIAKVLYTIGQYKDSVQLLEALYNNENFQREEVLFELIKNYLELNDIKKIINLENDVLRLASNFSLKKGYYSDLIDIYFNKNDVKNASALSKKLSKLLEETQFKSFSNEKFEAFLFRDFINAKVLYSNNELIKSKKLLSKTSISQDKKVKKESIELLKEINKKEIFSELIINKKKQISILDVFTDMNFLLDGKDAVESFNVIFKKLREDYDRDLLITVLGEFSVGKSTFINAIIGSDILPMDTIPTTATINLIKYGREESIRLVFRDGSIEEHPLKVLEDFAVETLKKGGPEEEKRKEKIKNIEFIEILLPIEDLRRINLVDTPGLNSGIKFHQEITENFIKHSDIILWIFRADYLAKKTEIGLMDFVMKYSNKIIGIINQIDRLDPDEDDIDDFLDEADKKLKKYVNELVPISARDALKGKIKNNDKLINSSNFNVIEKYLEENFFNIESTRDLKIESTKIKLKTLLSEVASLKNVEKKNLDKELKKINEIFIWIKNKSELFEKEIISKVLLNINEDFSKIHSEFAETIYQTIRENIKLGRELNEFDTYDIEYFSEKLIVNTNSMMGKTKFMLKESIIDLKRDFDNKWQGFFKNSRKKQLKKWRINFEGFYDKTIEDIDDYFENIRNYIEGINFVGFNPRYLDYNYIKTILPDSVNKKILKNTLENELESILKKIETESRRWIESYFQLLKNFSDKLILEIENNYNINYSSIYFPIETYMNKLDEGFFKLKK